MKTAVYLVFIKYFSVWGRHMYRGNVLPAEGPLSIPPSSFFIYFACCSRWRLVVFPHPCWAPALLQAVRSHETHYRTVYRLFLVLVCLTEGHRWLQFICSLILITASSCDATDICFGIIKQRRGRGGRRSSYSSSTTLWVIKHVDIRTTDYFLYSKQQQSDEPKVSKRLLCWLNEETGELWHTWQFARRFILNKLIWSQLQSQSDEILMTAEAPEIKKKLSASRIASFVFSFQIQTVTEGTESCKCE